MSKSSVVSSNIQKGQEGYFLVIAICLSLQSKDSLERFIVNNELELPEEISIQTVSEQLPYLSIGDLVIEEFNNNLFHELYKIFGEEDEFEAESLNYWLRAGAKSGGTVMNYYREAYDKTVIAAIIAKGGNLISALNL
jgi:hypothetical protein